MPTTHTGQQSGFAYTVPELTDPADIVTAMTQFSDSIPAYPNVRLNVTAVTGDTDVQVQDLILYSGASNITLTLPTGGLQDGDRLAAYQLGDGEIILNAGGTPVGGGVNSSGSKYGVVSAVYHGGEWFFLPFPL